MKVKYVALIGLLIFPTTLLAKKVLPVNKYSCKYVEYRIETIKERQREGYNAKQGERLRNELKLQKGLKRNCKKKELPTK